VDRDWEASKENGRMQLLSHWWTTKKRWNQGAEKSVQSLSSSAAGAVEKPTKCYFHVNAEQEQQGVGNVQLVWEAESL
jgi:hypothetical protein